jgi:hypothetical protein
LVLIVPSLNKSIIAKIESKIFDFLWDSKPSQVSKSFVIQKKQKGGMDLVDVSTFWKSLKVSWLRRMIFTNSFWKEILRYELRTKGIDIEELILQGNSRLSKLSGILSNPFWTEVFKAGSELMEMYNFSYPNDFGNFPLVANSLFKSNNMCWEVGIFNGNYMRVSDICIEQDNSFESRENFNRKWGLNIDFLTYNRILISVREGAGKLSFNLSNSTIQFRPHVPLLYSILTSKMKGCKFFYNILMGKHFIQTSTRAIENKWHTELGSIVAVVSWE